MIMISLSLLLIDLNGSMFCLSHSSQADQSQSEQRQFIINYNILTNATNIIEEFHCNQHPIQENDSRFKRFVYFVSCGGVRAVYKIIIIVRMIYAYCLSLFSVHFFGSHSIANFKLRLINQQTGDCTDSAILHAAKLTPSTFPVPIKLKGGQRLLVKVKLLSLPSRNNEHLVGEGVVTFDKNSIDNTLRVPIYDKQRGVEEVAICSIDFFLSGFEVDKHQSINPDKSRSRFEDWRERTEDAVYSQMSYTLESERESAEPPESTRSPKNNAATAATAAAKATLDGGGAWAKEREAKVDEKSARKLKLRVGEYVQSPRSKAVNQSIAEQQEEQPVEKNLHNLAVKPFTLENNIYLESPSTKKLDSNKGPLVQTRKKPPSNFRKKFALESEEEAPRGQISPDNLRKTVKDNEEVLSRLKQYIAHIEKEESPKHKRRRNLIKFEEFSTYKSQNRYIKYHVDLKPPPNKLIKNMRAIRIVENQIKEPSEEKVINQTIEQVALSSLSGSKLVSFDASGFRANCLSIGQSESVATIMIPTFENAVKVKVLLREEGQFEGVIGFQEGEAMNISLVRLGASEESILERSEFKFLFDIKPTDSSKTSARVLQYQHQDISFREPFELISPGEDIKTRVGQLSGQPWGFVKSYAEGVVLSAHSKQIMEKIDQELPPLRQQPKYKPPSSQPKSTTSKGVKHEELKSRSVSRQYLEASIKKPKAVPTHIRRETDSINSIRNGNRNGYRFQERNSSKQIKQAWEQLLFKRNIDEERKRQSEKQPNQPLKASNINLRSPKHQFQGRKAIHSFTTDSDSESFTTSKLKKSNKTYQFFEGNLKNPAFPARTLTLKIANVSITQPQAIVEATSNLNVGKFVKFAIKGKTIYFTEVIFNGSYNSILWKLEGCIFQELVGTQRLKIQIYQTLNNRITTLGISYIRVNRLFFLRNNHIYNGTITHQNTIFGEFTLGFEISENCPFEVIHEEDEETINLSYNPAASPSRPKALSHYSQKNIKRKNQIDTKMREKAYEESELSMADENEMEESMSMPLGLSQE